MTSSPIELWLSGPEASWIVRSLEDAGLEVQLAEALDDRVQDDRIVIAASDHRHLDEIRKTRRGPLIVVGWEELSAVDRERLDPTLFLPRPVPIARLIRTLRSLLGLPEAAVERPRIVPDADAEPEAPAEEPTRDRTIHLEDPDEDAPTFERTMQLDDDVVHPLSEVVALGSGSHGALDAPEALVTGPRDGLELAPFLNALLQAADRRLFPGEAPLDLRFAVGEESVLELVPDELLAEGSMQMERVVAADPLEAFTFVGTPDLLDTAAGRRSPQGTPLTISGRRTFDSPESEVEPSQTHVTREGVLPPGGALRMFWEVSRGRSRKLQIEIAGGDTAALTIREGLVVAIEASVFSALATELRERGMLRELCESEAEAKQAIERAVETGRLDPFARDRFVRERYEKLIGDLCMASECRFSLHDASATASRSILGAPLVAIATAELRKRLGAGNAQRWLHVEGDALLWLGPEFEARAERARLEPELVAAFERAAGQPVGAFLGELAATAGAAGALFSLASAGALRFEPGDKKPETSKALRERIEAAHALALDGDYFRVLGVPRQASTREIDEAYALRRKGLTHLDLSALGLDELEGARREALEAIDDAHDALRNERLRQAYARGLS